MSATISPSTPTLMIGQAEVLRFAEKLAGMLQLGDCLSFQGDLGSGKTTIIRHLIHQLAKEDVAVSSPTFTLLQTYDVTLANGTQLPLYHYDLYRLESEEELYELPLTEGLEQGITCIEWPALAETWLPDSRIEVNIEFTENNDNRAIWLQASPASQARLQEAGLWH
ncbi:MAG: tRNA (adenosine(37)-N6)-threonylcarbamoyltransferase complex ATPase subunit type 1 TsaE [Rickettsiales bacterium]|nr:tRNA (adenosine(37)-N6)-threonylcarbamoyltransferase complex ATPase subunit type 1 TsaE [Rickettsiales bacterium]|tara:strand:- start:177 stop:677 length:501 start_codon:yes stop_codon:yes gene_type:complete